MNAWRASFREQAESRRMPELRRRVQDFLRQQGVAEPLVDRTGLLVSELTHNAVAAAGGAGAVRVDVAGDGGEVRLEVRCDENTDLERLREALARADRLPGTDSERGRGLWLVLAFSQDLEVDRDEAGQIRVRLQVAPPDSP